MGMILDDEDRLDGGVRMTLSINVSWSWMRRIGVAGEL